MGTAERQRSLVGNAFLNLLGAVVPLVLTLVTLPPYLGLIGESRYGALTLVWLVVGYFSLFDLGLGRAAANQLARLSDDDLDRQSQLVWTAVFVNVSFGVVGGVILYWVGISFGGAWLGIPGPLWQEATPGLPWLAVAIPVITVSAVLTGALEGRELFLAANGVATFGAALYQVVPLFVALIWGADLGRLILAIVVSRILSLVAAFTVCLRVLRLKPWPRIRVRWARQLLRYGGWVTVSAVLSPVLTTLDRVAVGAMAGAHAVTYYAVPFNIASRIQLLPASLQRALFPRLSAVGSEEAKDTGAAAFLGLLVLLTPLTVAFTALATPFLALWIGPEMGRIGGSVAALLLPGMWINSLAFVPYTQLQAQGRPDITAKLHLAEVVPYLLVLWAGIGWIGVRGAAAAWTLRVAADAALLLISSGLGRRVARPLVVASALVLASTVSALAGSWASVAGAVGVALLTPLSVLWAWRVMPMSLRTQVWQLLAGSRACRAA